MGDLILKEQRQIVYDDKLNIEVISGIHQSFLKHFHDYYVKEIIRKGNKKRINKLTSCIGLLR